MYVCVCLAVTEAEVEAAIADGATTREAVTRACRAGGDCGACHGMIDSKIEDHLEDCAAASGEGVPRARPSREPSARRRRSPRPRPRRLTGVARSLSYSRTRRHPRRGRPSRPPRRRARGRRDRTRCSSAVIVGSRGLALEGLHARAVRCEGDERDATARRARGERFMGFMKCRPSSRTRYLTAATARRSAVDVLQVMRRSFSSRTPKTIEVQRRGRSSRVNTVSRGRVR